MSGPLKPSEQAGNREQQSSATNQPGLTTWTNPYHNPENPEPEAPHGLPSLYNPQLPLLPAHLQAVDDSLEGIASRLRNPLDEVYNQDRTTVTLSLQWAICVIGVEQFEYNDMVPRRVLTADSEIRQQGLEAGVTRKVHEWLVGNPAMDDIVLSADIFGDDKMESKDCSKTAGSSPGMRPDN